MTILEGLWGMFVLLSVADAVTTYHALKVKGTSEANPVMSFLFNKIGIMRTLVLTKVAAIAAVWYTMGEYSLYILSCINAVYLWVVWNNYNIWRK